MRYYQKQYFKTKSQEYLLLAKEYEGKVDIMIQDYNEQTLF